MSKEISYELQKTLVEAIVAYSERISQTDDCKAYMLGLGEEVPVELYNNLLYTIGIDKYHYSSLKKGEMISAVCTANGKEGLVFSYSGIYYKKDRFSESSYTEYEKCRTVHSVSGLSRDERFSQHELDEMFSAFRRIYELSAMNEQGACEKFVQMLKNNPNYFFEGREQIDKINAAIQTYVDADYMGRRRKIGLFGFKEKKKLDQEMEKHAFEIKDLVERRNGVGQIDGERKAIIKGTILYALDRKFFLDKSFDESRIYCDSAEEIREKALAVFSGCRDLTRRMITYLDEDEAIAFVDLSEGARKKGLLFETSCLQSMGCGGLYEREHYYNAGNCYLYFSKEDITPMFNPCKLNYVLDKIHKITEGKY